MKRTPLRAQMLKPTVWFESQCPPQARVMWTLSPHLVALHGGLGHRRSSPAADSHTVPVLCCHCDRTNCHIVTPTAVSSPDRGLTFPETVGRNKFSFPWVASLGIWLQYKRSVIHCYSGLKPLASGLLVSALLSALEGFLLQISSVHDRFFCPILDFVENLHLLGVSFWSHLK